MGIKITLVLFDRGNFCKLYKIGVGQMRTYLGVHHIGSHEDKLTSAIQNTLEYLAKISHVSIYASLAATTIVKTVADNAQVWLVAQNVTLHATGTSARGVSADSRIESIDGNHWEEYSRNVGYAALVRIALIKDRLYFIVCFFLYISKQP